MTAKRLTESGIKSVRPPKAGRVEQWDRLAPGLGLRITANGAKSWTLLYRFDGKLRRDWLGEPPAMSLDKAREEAQRSRAEARAGQDPRIRRQREQAARQRAEAGTFGLLVDDYDARHSRLPVKRRNRSWDETMRILRTYAVPQWGDRPVTDITRRDVAELLDKVQDGAFKGDRGRKFPGGPVMADAVLAQVRRLFNWHVARNDEFVSPVVKGMTRAAPARERARDRILTDDEIRLVWQCTDQPGAYSAFVRMLLLSAQRRENVASMDRADIDGEGVWTIAATKYKAKRDHFVPLPQAARDLIAAHPRINGSTLVFTTGGKTPIGGFSKAKAALDASILLAMKNQAVERGENVADVKPLPRWTHHDLRRTARSLMSRAGVPSDIAERVVGHVIPGVRGTYDRHTYLDEKREALRKLAALIARIVAPPVDNVVPLTAAAR